MKFLLHSVVAFLLTVLTQLGGVAWLASLCFKRKLVAFAFVYVGLSLSAVFLAPVFGREPLPCASSDTVKVQSWFYCATNRNYVTSELSVVLSESADALDRQFPGTQTLVLDANFPFLDGFPLLPHLSHDDGEKVDLAFFYKKNGEFSPGTLRSPIGYFAFEDGPSQCANTGWSLRWELGWLQGFWPQYQLDEERTSKLLRILADNPKVGKILLEPHLEQHLGLVHDKIRFQGCQAARHDDHIHLQLR